MKLLASVIMAYLLTACSGYYAKWHITRGECFTWSDADLYRVTHATSTHFCYEPIVPGEVALNQCTHRQYSRPPVIVACPKEIDAP